MIYSDPESEITINEQIVKELVREQFPDLSNLEVRFVDSGWDNENYKLGDQYLVRIPKRAIAAKLIEHEIYCLTAVG
jgi:aminoglycoside phosphotransferase (APT) family kinase protein